MSVMHDQPPGWYRDPVRPNRHRYWTGQDWIGPVGENLAVWRRAVRCAQSPVAQRQPPTTQLDAAQLEENAASNAAEGGSNASERTNSSASGAPRSRSMPASSHSTEIGPS
jgi:hypothetical protein